MFANLKNKIFEEVKASPQKFQQFAQAAQAAVSSTSSNASDSVSGSDNFFSITEEDTPQNSPLRLPSASKKLPPQPSNASTNAGAVTFANNGVTINRTRKLSNSSMASDVSFRLPAYDSPAVYHLQSDLDISASEVEDSAGPSPAHLDLISKEHLHSAYRKALERYQKYRSRYTDLAKRYRDLERDSTKARAVLVETQDKAIRRISELREQCSLEQQAKAHLEEALRMEMDDMQCKIKAYQTKLKLLGENPEVIAITQSDTKTEESLIQLDTEDDTNLIGLDAEKDKPNDNTASSNDVQLLNVKIVKLEELLAKYKQQLSESSFNLSEKTKEIDDLQVKLKTSQEINSNLNKREEENVILLAENKLMVHTELENKESEVKQLKQKIIELENNIKQVEKQAPNEHTIEELQNRVTEKEKAIENLKKSFDEQIKANSVEYEQKLQKSLGQNNENLNKLEQERQTLQSRISELETQKSEVEQKHEIVNKDLVELRSLLTAEKETKEKLTIESVELKTETSKLKKELEQSKTHTTACKNEIKELKSEIESMRIVAKSTESDAVKSLQESIQEANRKSEEKVNAIREEVNQKTNECSSLQQRIDGLTKELETSKTMLATKSSEEIALTEECRVLKVKLDEMTNDRDDRELQMEKERTELKSQVTNILQEISRMEGEMKGVKKSHADLEEEKRSLEKKIEKLTKQNQANQEGSQKWQALIREAEEKIHQLETKLQTVESENSQLAEKNCLLTENQNRLEIQIKESENNFKKEKASLNGMIKEAEINFSALRLENDTANETIKKLNEKMSQVLDENSRLHNAKELMEHEFRSLQDQCESREKEKLCVLDNNKCMEEKMQRLRDENDMLKEQSSNRPEKEKCEALLNELRDLKGSKDVLEKEIQGLKEEILASAKVKDDLKHLEEENTKLKIDITNFEKMCAELREQLEENKAKTIVTDENQQKLSSQIQTLESKKQELEEKLAIAARENTTIKEQNESFSKEIHMLNTQNQTRLSELENLLKRTNDEKQTLKESIKNATDLEKKLQNYEEQKIENEYLTTLTNQLEADIRKLNEERAKAESEINELKVKLKSLQCEMYVHVENKEKHDEEINAISQKLTFAQNEIEKLTIDLSKERDDAKQQKDHSQFITEQNDCLQKELLLWQQKLNEAEKLCGETRVSYEEITNENLKLKEIFQTKEEETKQEHLILSEENDKNKSIIFDLTKDLKQATTLLGTLQNTETENIELRDKLHALEIELNEKVKLKNESNLEASRANQSEMEKLRKINQTLQKELEDMKHKTSSQIFDLTQEIDDLTVTARHMTEKLTEYENLKIRHAQLDAEIDVLRQDANANNDIETDAMLALRQEKEDLEEKLEKIMHEVQDVSNRNLFLEQKCENYLILEQSNERLKLANDKLSRQLDETLVSMQHNEGISANTEFEYLKNIMFQYLTGHLSGNNSTLVKVIAAVLKFSPQQTQVAIEKEHQRHTLLGQINNLL